MKRTISLLLLLILALSLTACGNSTPPSPTPTEDVTDYSEKTIAVADAQYKYQGRTATLDNGGITFDWTNATFSFNAQCEGDIALTLTVRGVQDGYYSVIIDGGERQRINLERRVREEPVVIATGLERGYHTIEFIKDVESQHSRAVIHAITLSGELREAPAEKNLYMEVYGDSITCGFGNLTDNTNEQGHISEFEDGYQSYAAITARNLSADVAFVSESGYGVLRGWSEITIPMIYDYTSYTRNKELLYDFPRTADIVVVNLGTNDSSFKVTQTEFSEAMEAFVLRLRERNPNAHIIWAYGMMGNTYTTTIQNVMTKLGGADANYYYCALPANFGGGGAHPNLECHYEAADILTAFIQDLLS